MISIDARLTLIALVPLPMVSISVKYFGSAIHKRFEAIQAQLADLSAVVQEALQAFASSAPTTRSATRSHDSAPPTTNTSVATAC